jgi:hypothetical protein
MRLEKNNIHMNRVKERANLQFTLDEDVNVPDSKNDIGKMICSRTEVAIDSANFNDKKETVAGNCGYVLLYLSDEEKPKLENLSGNIPFREILNVDGADPEDNIRCQAYVEDFNIRVINSRKISIKAVINVVVTIENIYDEEIAVDAQAEGVKCRKDSMNYACIALNGNDIFRVREEFELPKNKPDVNRILWKNVALRGRQIRLLEDGFSMKGELNVFILYDTYEDGILEWYETNITFSGKIDYPGIHEEMVSDIELTLAAGNLELKTNPDGEDRLLSLEAEIQMDIRVYEEKTMDYLADLYSVETNLLPVRKDAKYEQLLVKNSAKCRLTEKVQMKPADSRILQICGVEGTVHMDEVTQKDEGILAEGAVMVDIMYITADDRNPVAIIRSAIPFSQIIEVAGACPDMEYTIRPNLEQLTATVLGNDEVEVRAFVNLDALVFNSVAAGFITDVTEDNSDMTWKTDFPGIIGYIAVSEEALWDIAKKFRTSVETIKTVNGVTADSMKKGEKILVTRE